MHKLPYKDGDRERVDLRSRLFQAVDRLVYSRPDEDQFDLFNLIDEAEELNLSRPFAYEDKIEVKTCKPCTVPMAGQLSFAIAEMNAINAQNYSLGCITTTISNQGNDPMNTNTQNDLEYRRGRYLETRLCEVSSEKQDELRKLYHIDDDDEPNSPKDMIARIADGKYTITEKTYYCGMWDGLHWRDPALPADEAGFKTAKELAEKKYQDVKDAIVLLPNDTALKAIKDFEAWLPTTATATAN